MQDGQIFEPTFLNLEYVFNKLYQFLHSIYSFFADLITSGNLSRVATLIFSIILIVLITITLYTIIRIYEVRKKEKDDLKKIVYIKKEKKGNEKWQQIEAHIQSNNPSDWKVAIMEADIILDEITQKLGVGGQNLGDRLKTIEPSDFQTIGNAWEAHKVRNNIAHQGSDYELTHKDAYEAIKNYEKVFQEFEYI